MKVASAYWLVLNLHRLGLPQVADSVLDEVTPDMDVIENFAYHNLLLNFKDGRTLEEIAGSGEEGDAIQNTTLAYGLAAWELINGDDREATNRFRSIVEGDQWAAFGFIAAEAELARAQD